MEMMQQENKNGIQGFVGERNTVGESFAEFSLPDYQPEMKRLLRVCAQLSPAEKYIGGQTAEFTGNVEYSILYAGNDRQLYSVSQTEEYNFQIPLDFPENFDWNAGIVCDEKTVVESVNSRLLGPRKVSVKMKFRSKVKLFATRLQEEKISGAEEKDLHRLTESKENMILSVGKSDPIALSESFEPTGGTEQMRVVFADAQVLTESAQARENEVDCEGKVEFKLLVSDESEETPKSIVMQKSIPFTQTIPVEGTVSGSDAVAEGICQNIKITVEEGKILCDMELILKAKSQRNEPFTYTKDLYSVKSPCEIKTEQIPLLQNVGCLQKNFSIQQQYPIKSLGMKAETAPVDCYSNGVQFETETENGKTNFIGKCKMQVVFAVDGEYSAQELDLPFRFPLERKIGEESDISVNCVNCRVKKDGENLLLNAEMAICGNSAKKANAEAVTEAVFSGAWQEEKKATYRICYPCSEDTLWSIAKQYHISCEDLAVQNAIQTQGSPDAKDSLAGNKYLLIS